jgi:hypothetical protein
MDLLNESSIEINIYIIKIIKFLIWEDEFFNEFKHKSLDKIIKKLDEMDEIEKNDKKIELALYYCKKYNFYLFIIKFR